MAELEFVISEGPKKGQAFPFPGPHFYVGSSKECHLRFEPGLVEPKHAEVLLDGAGVPWLRDLSGKQQVWINGEPAEKGPLKLGGIVRLGQLELVVREKGRGVSGVKATPAPVRATATGANAGVGATAIRPSQARQPAVSGTAVRQSGSGVATANDPAVSGGTLIRPSQANQQAVSGTAIRRSDANQPGLDATAKRPTPFAQPGTTPDAAQAGGQRSAALEPGTIIDGRYHIIGKLAAGGMGEVYRAEHVELGKAMALKVMLPELSQDPEFVARFKREAIAAGRIGQQNIVDISDFGRTQDGRFYFVMEFLDGLTLASTIHRQGALAVERAVNISLQACRALAAAHAQSIVHRDLKPENIMLLQRPGQPDFVKVLDFGVAKVSHGQGQGGHTAVGMVVGTPQYMSPEQAKAVPVDARSDIYSMGLIIYELVTGRPTFEAETPSMLMVKHVTEAPPAMTPGPISQVPPLLEQLIFRMLEKEPAARPQSMEEVVQTLETVWAQVKSGAPMGQRVSGDYAPVGAPPPQRPSGPYPAPVSGQLATAPITGQQYPLGQPYAPPPSGAQYAPPISGPNPAVAAPKKSNLPLVLGGVVVVAALGGGVAWTFREPPPPPAPVVAPVPTPPPPPVVAQPEPVKPVEPAAPALVKLTFTSEPAGAEVLESDLTLGNTPFALERKPGEIIQVTFKLKGYKDETKKVRFESDATVKVDLQKVGGPPRPKPPPTPGNPYEQEEDLKDNPF
jgi:serine/threonine-protein kinase